MRVRLCMFWGERASIQPHLHAATCGTSATSACSNGWHTSLPNFDSHLTPYATRKLFTLKAHLLCNPKYHHCCQRPVPSVSTRHIHTHTHTHTLLHHLRNQLHLVFNDQVSLLVSLLVSLRVSLLVWLVQCLPVLSFWPFVSTVRSS